MNITVEKILEFHDLFPEENSLDVKAILKKYNRETLVYAGHTLSNNYNNAYFPADIFSQQ